MNLLVVLYLFVCACYTVCMFVSNGLVCMFEYEYMFICVCVFVYQMGWCLFMCMCVCPTGRCVWVTDASESITLTQSLSI